MQSRGNSLSQAPAMLIKVCVRFAIAAALCAPFAAHADVQRAAEQAQPFRVGGMVGVVSAPRPLDAELFVRLDDLFSIGASYSDFPSAIANPLLSVAGAKTGSLNARLDDFHALEVDLRFMPWQGAFFIGSSFGRQSLSGAIFDTGQKTTVDLTTFYATPRVGWLWTLGPGLLLGFDVGAQLKLVSSANVVVPAGTSTNVRNATQALADLGSSYPLPSLHLRLGWIL
jgi:hypothetical protein